GQFLIRGFVVLLRKNNPQNRELKTAVEHGVTHKASMDIHLNDILTFPNPKDYKIHLATWNGKVQPLEVFVRDKMEWEGWNSWRSEKDDFNRKYIFSLMD